MRALFGSVRLNRPYTWEPKPSTIGFFPSFKATSGKFSPRTTSPSCSRPNRLSPRVAVISRPTSPCTRGEASGSSKLVTAGKRRCCPHAVVAWRTDKNAHTTGTRMLDIEFRPQDFPLTQRIVNLNRAADKLRGRQIRRNGVNGPVGGIRHVLERDPRCDNWSRYRRTQPGTDGQCGRRFLPP